LILAFDAHAALPPALARHLEGCDACRARWETDRRLAHALKQGTFPRQDPTPSDRIRRIRHAVVTALQSTPPRSASWSSMGLRLAPGLALVLLAALALWRFEPPSPSMHETPDHHQAPLSPPELLRAVDALWPGSSELMRLSSRLDQPLEAELNAVVSDARSAVQGLASNFLPQR